MVRQVQSRIDTSAPASLNRRNYRHVNRLFQERERAIEQARLAVMYADRRYKAIKVQHEEKRQHPPLLFRRPKDREAGFDRLQPNLFDAQQLAPPPRDKTMPADLLFHLGTDPVPVGQRRTPPVPQDVRARVSAVQRSQSARGAREWEQPTRRERAMLWGTSLAPVPLEACVHDAVQPPTSPKRGKTARKKRGEKQAEDAEIWKQVRNELLNKMLEKRDEPLSEEEAFKETEKVWKEFDGREGGRSGLRSCLWRLLSDLSLHAAAKRFLEKHPLH